MLANGMHHVSSITKEALDNHDFYTKVLGLRMVKKTVNQDDPSMYHLFYADYQGTPGTDMTFFEIVNSAQYRQGTNGITRTFFRVPTLEALEFFKARFQENSVYHEGVIERYGYTMMNFEDNEKHRMALVVADAPDDIIPHVTDEISAVHAIRGILSVEVTIQHKKPFIELLELLGGTLVSEDETEAVVQYGQEFVYVVEKRESTVERNGYGSVHHFALNVDTKEDLLEIEALVNAEKWPNSGLKDRYWFESLYINASGNIIIEIATKGPGFTVDEPLETLGESLVLPPKLENERDFLEFHLEPIN